MNNNTEELKKKFQDAMIFIYKEAKRKYNYNGVKFFQMIREYGGVDAAKKLLYAPRVLSGFTELFMRGGNNGLSLTAEALVIQSKWKNLFTPKEKEIAQKRLKELGYIS